MRGTIAAAHAPVALLVVPDPDQPDVPWVKFDTAWTDTQNMSSAYRVHRDNVPADLVPCDVVPRETT